jgi:hypothetical protein
MTIVTPGVGAGACNARSEWDAIVGIAQIIGICCALFVAAVVNKSNRRGFADRSSFSVTFAIALLLLLAI